MSKKEEDERIKEWTSWREGMDEFRLQVIMTRKIWAAFIGGCWMTLTMIGGAVYHFWDIIAAFIKGTKQ